jgi:hypothetical protein
MLSIQLEDFLLFYFFKSLSPFIFSHSIGLFVSDILNLQRKCRRQVFNLLGCETCIRYSMHLLPQFYFKFILVSLYLLFSFLYTFVYLTWIVVLIYFCLLCRKRGGGCTVCVGRLNRWSAVNASILTALSVLDSAWSGTEHCLQETHGQTGRLLLSSCLSFCFFFLVFTSEFLLFGYFSLFF